VWIPQLPEALLWDHNAHYHRALVRAMPPRVGTALDVGCGTGGLARQVAARADQVDAVDRSAVMIDRAAAAAPANVRFVLGDVLDETLPLDPRGYDVVTAVSGLHHMPLRPALRRLAALVRPGGTLAVIGLYRQVSPSDRLIEAAALPANAAMGVVLKARGLGGKQDGDMPVIAPGETWSDIRAAAREILPGALPRRRLFWRYSLLWRPSDHQ
jgi:SAM-dependent methyltransferase